MKVTPSQVVKKIEQYWPQTIPEETQRQPQFFLSKPNTAQVRTIVEMCRDLDPTVLPTGETAIPYREALADLESCLKRWDQGDKDQQTAAVNMPDWARNPMSVIRMVLKKCDDDPVAAAISNLPFIKDLDVRAELGQDIEEAKRALANREWKSATVVAASVVEALLLWAIDQKPAPDQTNAVQDAINKKKLSGKPDASLDKWVLADLIPIAAELKLIEDDTEKQADLARDFRNYIHPGRVRRKGKRCDEATAHGARAAVLLVIRDLKKNFPNVK